MTHFIGCLTLGLTCLGMPATAQDAAVGAELYGDFCAVCHGVAATGDGPMAEVLTIPPTDLTALSEEGVFPTFRVVRQIDGRAPMLVHGGAMPVFGPWFEGDGADIAFPLGDGQRVMVSRPIADLVAYLQEIQS